MVSLLRLSSVVLLCFVAYADANGATVVFFDPSQVATPVASGATWDTISSNGYLFTYTMDKLFTGGIGPDPIGRPIRVSWPTGVEAQAVTAGPNPSKAKITIERVDGDVFDLTAFTAELLANTGGAGGSFEVVPFLNGEEILPDPVVFDATGYTYSTFSYNESPNPLGSTAPLKGYDKYSIDLYVDFALIGLTLQGAPIPPPPGDYNQNGVVDAADYVLWRTTDGTQTGYDTWRSHFGQTAGSGAAILATDSNPAVPEPVLPMTLLVIALATSLYRYSRSNRRAT